MNRADIIAQIQTAQKDADLTILKSARFKKHPLRAAYFYAVIALNRYTPLLLPVHARTLWGDRFTAYETSAVGSMYFLGFYDSDISLFLLKHFHETGDLLDVGSNIGYYTSLYTNIAAPTATITAFEPTPSTFALLQKNVGHLPRVTCEKIALSDQTGVTTFYDYGHRHGVYNSTIQQPLAFLQALDTAIEVPTETLDSWCERTGNRPSLIKLDTEGSEAGILRYATKTLTTYQPLILLEVGGGDAWSKNNNDSLDILSQHGYEFFTATAEGDLLPHTRQASYQYTNLIAIHSDKLPLYVTKN